jgi:uncharacterized protein
MFGRWLGLVAAGAVFLVAGVPPAFGEVAVPPLKARVTDLTGTLSAEQRQALEHTLAEFESRKGSQIALLMVPSTQPETVEQYAVRVQEAWRLGRKGIDDGVLLLVAKDDRRLKIEVGYGLEGVLPDAIAKRIIEQDITPRFKQGDFYGGVRAGADRLMKVIDGEPLPAPGARAVALPQFDFIEWIVIGLIVVSIAQAILQAIFGRFLGSGLTGAAAGLLVWLVAGWLIVAVVIGVVVFLLSVFAPPASAMRRGGGWSGSSGGGWSSGGGGGGGFSGGGGSSGGGGASGSW